VRRSFDGSYGPLYQIAYLIGGLQFYSPHHELVDSKKMTHRAFHDRIYRENRMPVEMVRDSDEPEVDAPFQIELEVLWRIVDDSPNPGSPRHEKVFFPLSKSTKNL
jgi:hypothetical protein